MTTAMLTQLLGGIGMFLLGMLLLTEGLKTAAGAALKRALVRFTGRPGTAFLSGLTITALVQSSSATTLATIGFVSAGLLSFAQAIGIVIGGSVGTTTTGWLVSLLGLKLSVGAVALPLVGAGALMRLVLKGRPAAVGLAIAGFGLIFVGIDTLQEGMMALANHVRPDVLPAPTFAGRLLLVLVGVVMTVVMQSSSAAVATTITAFHAGTLDLDQALSLVIGASIGTTVTAALASIGASVPARRTALAHILFNTFAGALGFLLEPLFTLAVRRLEWGGGVDAGAMSLAIFHTTFSLLGALLVLPAVPSFVRLVTRLVPERGPALTQHLDASLEQVPEVAVEAIRRTLIGCARGLLDGVRVRWQGGGPWDADALAAVQAALREARRFLGRVPPFAPPVGRSSPRLAVVHALDHLDQLAFDLANLPLLPVGAGAARLAPVHERLAALLTAALTWLGEAAGPAPIETVRHLATEVAELRRTGREAILAETAHGDLSPEMAAAVLDAVRWMDSAAYHTWRIVHHLGLSEHQSNHAIGPGAPSGDDVRATN
jgi:phosphate:Na+ symporter